MPLTSLLLNFLSNDLVQKDCFKLIFVKKIQFSEMNYTIIVTKSQKLVVNTLNSIENSPKQPNLRFKCGEICHFCSKNANFGLKFAIQDYFWLKKGSFLKCPNF